jgi:hypothetical protein
LIERVADSRASLILVVDEAPPSQLSTWGAAAHRANGRIRLLTVGHTRSLDATHLTEVELKPLERDAMLEALRTWHPDMPAEQRDFIADFSDGYVRLARLTGVALKKNPGMNARDLLRDHQIRALMDALLGPAQGRRNLHVVAVLTSVGWERKRAEEGAAIAAHFGLRWEDVRIAVREFDERMGIAPRAGDLRYISPVPLGVYLAIEAWEANPDQMERLVAVLPTDAARRAYYERLEAVIASPSAREVAQEQLGLFLSWERFTNELDVERWAAISRADPSVAAARVRRVLEGASREQRLQISGKARRALVNSLSDLAWGSSTFIDAVIALAYLADAENEMWSNNASGEFRSRFQVFLGGTAAPFAERLKAIDILLTLSEDSYRVLSVEALAIVGEGQASRMAPSSKPDSAREPEWQPRTGQERIDAIIGAIDRLDRLASEGRPGLKEPLAKAAERLRRLLRYRECRERVANLFRIIVKSYPALRQKFRQELRQIIELETQHWKELPAEDVQWLESLYAEFEDRTPEGRLREVVAMRDYKFDVSRLEPLASEVLVTPELLSAEWGWLTSGEAIHAWHLGVAVARRDPNLTLLPQFLALNGRGPDIRFLAGYIHEAVKTRGQTWADDLLDRLKSERPEDIDLVAELSWRCTPTDRGVERLAALAERGALPVSTAGQLVFGGWCLEVSRAAFEQLARVLVGHPKYRPAALAILEHRLKEKPDEWEALESLVLELLEDSSLFKTSDMNEYHWIILAKKLVPSHARQIAAILLAAHAEREDKPWFLEHSQVKDVLSGCIKADPIAVWEELRTHLEHPPDAPRFTIGFPSGVLERLPHEDVLAWVAVAPDPRALLVAKLVAKNLATGSLGEKLLAAHVRLASLGNVYFSEWVSGGWWGPASAHWLSTSEQLKVIATNTKEPAVADWARHAAESFRQMAERERKREEEEQIRWK